MLRNEPNSVAGRTVGLVDIPALTRNGYQRTPRAEADIQALWLATDRQLCDAFASPDDGRPGQRATEALIFFLRRAVLSGDRRTAEALFGHLMSRCERAFSGAIRGIDEDGRNEIRAEVLADITRLLLADDDSGDFLQARFWLYLKRRIVTARRDWLRAKARMPLSGDMVNGAEDDGPDPEPISADLTPEDLAILGDALARLPDALRELVVLRHYAGWRVGDESADRKVDGEPTLAERYGITPRAVRKRLARAEALLKKKEDQ